MSLQRLPDQDIIQVLYREPWVEAMRKIQPPRGRMLHKGSVYTCELWFPFQAGVLEELGSSLANLQRFSTIAATHRSMVDDCKQCTQRTFDWQGAVYSRVIAIQPFALASWH